LQRRLFFWSESRCPSTCGVIWWRGCATMYRLPCPQHWRISDVVHL